MMGVSCEWGVLRHASVFKSLILLCMSRYVICLERANQCFITFFCNVASSPFAIVVAPATIVEAQRSVASGLGVSQTVEGYTSRFQLQLKDVYSNPIDAPLVCSM